MIPKLMMMLQGSRPPYRSLTMEEIPGQLRNQYNSPIFLTPRYQMIPFTEQFLKYMRYFKRKDKVTSYDMRTFTQNLLVQYYTVFGEDRPQFQLQLSRNVGIKPNYLCTFNGEVDWMLRINEYKKTPIMFFHQELNPAAGIAMALSNMYMRKVFQPEPKKVHGYSIITTGHQWQLIKIDSLLKLKKSVILEGRKDDFKKIYYDEEVVAAVMGMMEYTLEIPQVGVQVLDMAYDYMDDKKYMLEAESKEEAEKMSLVSRLLLRYYKGKI